MSSVLASSHNKINNTHRKVYAVPVSQYTYNKRICTINMRVLTGWLTHVLIFLLFGYRMLNPPGKTVERYTCNQPGIISTGEEFSAVVYMSSFTFTNGLQPGGRVYVGDIYMKLVCVGLLHEVIPTYLERYTQRWVVYVHVPTLLHCCFVYSGDIPSSLGKGTYPTAYYTGVRYF